jgi:cephalosporin hydroxylase
MRDQLVHPRAPFTGKTTCSVEGRHRSVRELVHLVPALMMTPVVCGQLRRFDARPDPITLVDQVMNNFLGGLFRPMQARGEILELTRRLQAMRPRRLVEVGTCRGGTLLVFARSADPEATIVSVDLPGGSGGGGYPWWRKRWYRAFALPRQRIELLQGNSRDSSTVHRVRELFDGQPLDFLFIDGDHSYEGVRRDFELYGPLVRPGGMIALHDINPAPWSERQNGMVPRFWMELEANYETEEFIERPGNGFGIGVVHV